MLPLRGTVVFPSVAAPIAAGRDKTIRAIDRAISGNRLLFATAQTEAEIEQPTPEHLHDIGTVCRIAQMQKVPGGVQMVIQGDRRAAALEYEERDGYLEVGRPRDGGHGPARPGGAGRSRRSTRRSTSGPRR